MCFDPATMAAISMITTVASAVGSLSKGQSAGQSGDYNSAIQDNAAIAAQQKAEYDAGVLRKKGDTQRAIARVGYGKGGVAIEGTPLLFLADSAEQNELDAQALIYGGDVRAGNYRAQANLSQMEARSAERAGVTTAGTTLLTGLGKASSAYTKSTKAVV
jgi:hypothetical protein